MKWLWGAGGIAAIVTGTRADFCYDIHYSLWECSEYSGYCCPWMFDWSSYDWIEVNSPIDPDLARSAKEEFLTGYSEGRRRRHLEQNGAKGLNGSTTTRQRIKAEGTGMLRAQSPKMSRDPGLRHRQLAATFQIRAHELPPAVAQLSINTKVYPDKGMSAWPNTYRPNQIRTEVSTAKMSTLPSQTLDVVKENHGESMLDEALDWLREEFVNQCLEHILDFVCVALGADWGCWEAGAAAPEDAFTACLLSSQTIDSQGYLEGPECLLWVRTAAAVTTALIEEDESMEPIVTCGSGTRVWDEGGLVQWYAYATSTEVGETVTAFCLSDTTNVRTTAVCNSEGNWDIDSERYSDCLGSDGCSLQTGHGTCSYYEGSALHDLNGLRIARILDGCDAETQPGGTCQATCIHNDVTFDAICRCAESTDTEPVWGGNVLVACASCGASYSSCSAGHHVWSDDGAVYATLALSDVTASSLLPGARAPVDCADATDVYAYCGCDGYWRLEAEAQSTCLGLSVQSAKNGAASMSQSLGLWMTLVAAATGSAFGSAFVAR